VETAHASGGAWQSGVVYFATVRLSDFAEAVEPTEALHQQVIEAFRAAARFFDERSLVWCLENAYHVRDWALIGICET
jgi:hypothetical protein